MKQWNILKLKLIILYIKKNANGHEINNFSWHVVVWYYSICLFISILCLRYKS